MQELVVASETPLSEKTMVPWLQALLHHASVHQSGYAVSAIAETYFNGQYLYFPGVNVEDAEHNRLSMHAEQTALINLAMFTKAQGRFSKVWIMGLVQSSDSAAQDEQSASTPVPCGHCRQILYAFSTRHSVIIPVSATAEVLKPQVLWALLPEPFSADHLNLAAIHDDKNSQDEVLLTDYQKNICTQKKVSLNDIFYFISRLKPLIINKRFQTSLFSSVLLKLINGAYVPGILVQDIAFLTTDAIFAAVALAITQFGDDRVRIAEIHLFSNEDLRKNDTRLTGSEINLLCRYSINETLIYGYDQSGLQFKTNLVQCVQAEISRNLTIICANQPRV